MNFHKLRELLKLRPNEPKPGPNPISPREKRKLQIAQARAKRLEDIVVAYTGAELSAITGRDIE